MESIPGEAIIYLNGTNTNKLSPDSILGLETGNYQVTLNKDNFFDSTFNVLIAKDSTTSISVILRSKKSGTGNLSLESVPNGAKIFLTGTDTKKITPDSI